MGTIWLANAEPETSWAHHAWTDFAAPAQKEYAIVVLPLHGFARHGADRPLDIEEVLGASVLRQAVAKAKAHFAARVLPPLRFAPAAKTDGLFGIDSETAYDLVAEIAAGVAAAGFHKLVFFNVSPINEPFVAVAALDACVRSSLRTYVIHARSLGLDPSRDQAGDVAPLPDHLAKLLMEIRQHLAPPVSSPVIDQPIAHTSPTAIFPIHRTRYLPAFPPSELAG
jgi:creatinine amidohydrolase